MPKGPPHGKATSSAMTTNWVCLLMLFRSAQLTSTKLPTSLHHWVFSFMEGLLLWATFEKIKSKLFSSENGILLVASQMFVLIFKSAEKF